MAGNHVLLETISLTQSASLVTFDNLPSSGYTDLKILVSARGSAQNVGYDRRATYIQFNGSTSISTVALTGAPGSYTNSTGLIGFCPSPDATTNAYSNIEIYVPNYSTSLVKTFSIECTDENNTTVGDKYFIGVSGGLWNNTAAITSIAFSIDAGSFVAGSTFSLYGVAAVGTTPATAPKATGGNIVANDGTYWYHAFLSSGTFTPQTALTCDVLTIAGGGAGGRGGGGAGGLVYAAAQALTASSQNVLVGAGGAQRNSDGAGLSNPGNNSQFASLTAAVGGGAAAGYSVNGGNGGSGGGAGWGGGAYSGGSGTAGQGNAGGAGNNAGGGGGGAGASAASGAAGTPTVGGIGLNTYSSWATATSTGDSGYYAGGGGASGNTGQSEKAGGLGGGGIGRSTTGATPTAGIANTGGGGGGGSGSTTIGGAAGGSGVVIIRYAMV